MAHGKAEAFTTDFALLLQRSKCVDVTCRAAIGKRMAALARSGEPEVGEPRYSRGRMRIEGIPRQALRRIRLVPIVNAANRRAPSEVTRRDTGFFPFNDVVHGVNLLDPASFPGLRELEPLPVPRPDPFHAVTLPKGLSHLWTRLLERAEFLATSSPDGIRRCAGSAETLPANTTTFTVTNVGPIPLPGRGSDVGRVSTLTPSGPTIRSMNRLPLCE